MSHPAATLDAALAAGGDPLPLFKQALRAGDALLAERFAAGAPAGELTAARAAQVDELVTRAWREIAGMAEADVALVAVGGYGRGELYPHSDVDLLILLGATDHTPLCPSTERFIRFLWDLGLRIGHSVRTLAECVAAAADVTVMTTLLESRLLAGPSALLADLKVAVGPDRLWPSRAFYAAKLAEQQTRHRRFHDTAYNLEPNLKEGPGGLRDLATIGWVAKRHFHARTFHDLVVRHFLTEGEYRKLMACQGFLGRVRFGLHLLAGRAEERLLFDYQRPLAERLGYRQEGHRLAVEGLMRDYYQTVMELSRLNEMLLQLFDEELLGDAAPGPALRLNARFRAREGYLEAADPRLFRRAPFALLELFLLLAEHPELKGVRATTIRLVRDHLHLIDPHFRADLRARSLFMELLHQPQGITRALRRMHRYGVLAAYLPEFGRIVGQMQYDLFHAYTVDEHTLFVLRNARRLFVPALRHELPTASAVAAQLPKPELLYIAALYHDIAKGRGGDHSELGEKEAEAFCRRHGLSRWDTALVAWLVRHHLEMSATAQRKEIDDPAVIHDFATRVGDQVRLDYLYLLTVSDIRATNSELWNSWKAALLRDLYGATKRALRRGLENPPDRDERIRGVRAEARRLLAERGIGAAAVDRLWADFTDDYFLRHSGPEAAWHTAAIAAAAPAELPLVAIEPHSERGGSALFVYAPQGEGVFATTAATLDQFGLNILDARIVDLPSGHRLDTYIVLDEAGEPLTDDYRSGELRAVLREALRDRRVPPPLQRRLPRRHQHIPIRSELHFSPDPRNPRTVLELFAMDRPGLLSRVGHAFLESGVRLHNAKIATFGSRAEDVFYITDNDNRPYADPVAQERLRGAILRRLEE